MALKARHMELVRKLQQAARELPDPEVAAEDELEAAIESVAESKRAKVSKKPGARPKAASAAASLAASPAPKLVITVEQC